MSDLLLAALQYQERGFSVIPVGPDKKPLVLWKQYQEKAATPEQITEWWQKWPDAMIGIVTGKVSAICVIDRDDMKERAIEEYLPDAIAIPSARTPRGGQHYYFCMPEQAIGNNAKAIPGCDFRGEGGYVVAPPSRNGIGQAYIWLDGLSIFECDLPPLPVPIIKVFSLSGYGSTERDNVRDRMFAYGRRDDDLFHTANHLVKGGMPADEIVQVLENLIISWGEASDEKWIKAKVESAVKRSARKETNLAEDVRRWVCVTDGYFSVTDCYKALQNECGVTNRDNVRQIMHRLSKDRVIEKYGTQNGVYRRVDQGSEVVEWWTATGEPYPIILPLGIGDLARVYPRNIITIAGSPNAGKTCFSLNIAHENIGRHPIRYLISEMGGNELRNRLSNFEGSRDKWREVEFRERSSNFSDMLLPDGLNVIDYLEISDKFWLVAEELRRVYEKLNSGVAVVCLQKSQGKDAGRGGDFSLEKPRLYFNLDQDPTQGNILTIRKAKEWVGEINPNGLKRRFKIVKGARLYPNGDWYR